jgi:hypothetical protein
VATSTLANFPNSHQLFAQTVRHSALSSFPKLQSDFLVFPTGNADHPWRIAALVTNETVSRHKSLIRAIKKCPRLNERCHNAPFEQKIALSGFSNANTGRAYYKGVGE